MRNLIYWTTTTIIFVVLVAGIDGLLGDRVWFYLWLLIAWAVQIISGNWDEVKTWIKILKGE